MPESNTKQADLVLIQPPVHLMPTDLGAKQVSPNIGLAYMAGQVRRAGRGVRVVDAHAEELPMDEIVRRTLDVHPALVGISAMTYQIPAASMAAKTLRKAGGGFPIVLGGCHATALPERTLEEFPEIDATAVGEGESTVLQVLDDLADGGLRSRPGVYVRGGDHAASREPHPVIDDLDGLALPAFDLFPLRSYWPFYSRTWRMELPVSASRGCPFQCTFCMKAMGDQARFRSSESLVEEMAVNRADHGMNQAIFTDENFTLRKSLVHGFCEGMIRRGLAGTIRLICQSRVQIERGTLNVMARAGFTHITFGIESGDQEILDKACKSIRLEQSRDAVANAKAAGMVVDGNFVLGLPYETEQTVKRTIRFACSLPLDYASLFLLVPYPGSEVFEMARRGEGNLRLLSEDWEDFGKQTGGAVELTTIPRRRLEQLQFRGYLRFYGHPRRWLPVFRKVSLRTVLSFLWQRLVPSPTGS